VRAWNQTGQKFAGEPDLVKLFLVPRPTELWLLVIVTYLWEHSALVDGFDAANKTASVGGLTGLVLMAFTFKLAFAREDAPELVVGWPRKIAEFTEGATLIARARAVFVALGIALAVVVFYGATRRTLSRKLSGTMPTFLYASEQC
jgi:ethanolamine phosphate transferase 2 subunit G